MRFELFHPEAKFHFRFGDSIDLLKINAFGGCYLKFTGIDFVSMENHRNIEQSLIVLIKILGGFDSKECL